MSSQLYDTDFHAWAVEQAALLRQRKLDQIDFDNIAEEIASLGRSEKRELRNRLIVLLTHLLKWQVQTAYRSGSWRLTIVNQQQALRRHFADNPSLQPTLPDVIAEEWDTVIRKAVSETGFDESTFPPKCPWTADDVLAKPMPMLRGRIRLAS
jgi:hypothetical protein